mgnify:CR=1 FL=1
MILSVLAAVYTFTATATGVEKGTPVEFFFAASDSDRDYETLFVLDQPIDRFCKELEKAGLPRGIPTDLARCRLWPFGCAVSIKPAFENFVEASNLPSGLKLADVIYTGGTRDKKGLPDAATNMPKAIFSLYSLAQAPFVFNGIYPQGDIYGCLTARKTLKKGERVSFEISWDSSKMPCQLELTAKTSAEFGMLLKSLKDASEKGEVNALVTFDGELTLTEATAFAQALSMVDSPRVKLNGVTNVFFRSFLPLVKWRDRKERLLQPFELTLGDPDKLVFIDEDWSVDGPDPKLTPQEIPFDDAVRHPKTTTCLIYASPETTVGRLMQSIRKLKGSAVRTWYVFQEK